MEIQMDKADLMPPLRLILTSNCNGACYFCHHEGYCQSSVSLMPHDVLNDCISAAKDLGIHKINLSGGEPTLLENISEIVCLVKDKLPTIKLSLTTNGVYVHRMTDTSLRLLNKINLSIASFSPSVFRQYQNVDPRIPIQFLKDYSDKTTINIVVTDDNKDELVNLINECLHLGFSVDVMFDLIGNDLALQKEILMSLTSEFGLLSICYGYTPTMEFCNASGIKLRVKTPVISRIVTRNICSGCPCYNHCTEKICGLRVFPDGEVTPCLNKHIISNKETTKEKILHLYPKLAINIDNMYSFFFEST